MNSREAEGLRCYRARSWIAAAKACEHLDGKFIFYWIGFNALYGQEFAADRLDMKYFLEGVIASADDGAIRTHLLTIEKDVLDLLALEFLYRDYWRSGYTNALAERITQNLLTVRLNWSRPETCLPTIFECLYELRNQILHGSAKFGSRKNRDSHRAAVPILAALVPAFCVAMEANGKTRGWGTAPKPPKGSKGHPPDKRTRLNPIRVYA